MAEFNKGDKVLVAFEGKVTYDNGDDEYDIEFDGKEIEYVPAKNMTLIAPTGPEEPPVGTIYLHHGEYPWIRQADGWHSINYKGELSSGPGGKWDSFSHRKSLILNNGKLAPVVDR